MWTKTKLFYCWKHIHPRIKIDVQEKSNFSSKKMPKFIIISLIIQNRWNFTKYFELLRIYKAKTKHLQLFLRKRYLMSQHQHKKRLSNTVNTHISIYFNKMCINVFCIIYRYLFLNLFQLCSILHTCSTVS